MDLESEYSVLESVEDNELMNPEILPNVTEKNVENSGEQLRVDTKSEAVNSSPLRVQSPRGSIDSSPMKGYGLKKWRRIRRDVNQDGGSNVDSSKILKRGLPNSTPNSRNPTLLSVGTKEKSEGSISSVHAVVKNPIVANDIFAAHGDNGFVVGSVFSAGTDSENSEDRSSKSSTAASGPRLRYEIPAVAGYGRDKSRMKSLYGKNLNNAVQQVQQGKGQIEISKKPRGERVKFEKENSHSSMESDSRSSNFVFMQGANFVTSNGRQSGRSANYDDGENSDEAQDGEQRLRGERLTDFRENSFEGVSQEDLAADLSWEIKEEKSDNHESSTDQDPLVVSIVTLQSVQEALEKEILKLRDIGQEEVFPFNDAVEGGSLSADFTSFDPKVRDANSSAQFPSDLSRQSSPNSLETQMISLKQNVNLLENKLEEATAMLEMKRAKVIELEAALNSRPPKEETGATTDLKPEKHIEMENELDGLFKQKIEAEIEYLAISRATQNLRVASVGQITLLEEQKILASEQAQMLNKLEHSKRKVNNLKRQPETLETYRGDIVEADEVLKLQKRVCKFTSYFFIQLILLVAALGLLLQQLSPHYSEVVPT